MRMQTLSLMCALLISTVAASGTRAQSRTLEVDIPFAFAVGSQQMPSASYQVHPMPTGDSSLQVIRSSDGTAQVIISTMATPSQDATGTPKFVFHRYGEQYFLAEIRNWDGHTRRLFVSLEEKEVVRTKARMEIPLLARASGAKPPEHHSEPITTTNLLQ